MTPFASSRGYLLAATLTLGACAHSCPEPHRIDALADALHVPEGDDVAFTASSDPRRVGLWTSRAYGDTRNYQKPPLLDKWVVPLVDPGASIAPDGTVYAWLASRGSAPRGTDPRKWLDKVAAEFDGKPQVRRVTARAGTRESRKGGYRQAITDAEDRHGLTSHPDAPVFLFP